VSFRKQRVCEECGGSFIAKIQWQVRCAPCQKVRRTKGKREASLRQWKEKRGGSLAREEFTNDPNMELAIYIG
jgi:hypothetical protein